jgi:hypothetical protein
MFSGNLISQSGQGRKAMIALVVSCVGGLMTIMGSFFLTSMKPGTQFIVAIGGVSLTAAGFLLACTAIRCPRCGKRWVWDAMRSQAAGRWLAALLSARLCPSCGYSGSTDRERV